ncbi:MAG: hypothetical protein OFPII_07270 [Osedax symbiont Rs1]|nr:MAG: hypothetical protein OFPII_07270 [Osedax symbiont Rs1]
MYEFLDDAPKHADASEDSDDTWPILIVDDEPAVHIVTRFALEGEVFEGKKLIFISAYGAEEAKQILNVRSDIAVVLLDVVMETDTAGLELIAWIREELENNLIRIILRTGQPGHAPENTVIVDYDIFDYKNKTELTAQNLFSCVISGLRSYRDVLALSNHGIGLKKVIEATANLFKTKYASEYATGVLLQLTSLLYYSADAALVDLDSSADMDLDSCNIIAAVGRYEKFIGRSVNNILSEKAINEVQLCSELIYKNQANNQLLFSYKSRDKHKTLLCIKYKKALSDDDINLIELFVQSIAIAQERMRFWQETEDTLNDIITLQSKIFEEHSKQGDHYFTGVTKIATLLAKKHGLTLKRQISKRQG